MQVHLVQYSLIWEDPPANFRIVRQMLDSRVDSGDLVVLPEMFDTGFSFNLAKTADTSEETLGFLRGLARELGATVHAGRTTVNPSTGKGLNRATVLSPEGLLCDYAKIHPFSFGRESEHFVGGKDVVTYQWKSDGSTLSVCPAVCYDLRFPELFREGLRRGAEAFALGANWPSPRAHHWRALTIARAIENQAFVFAVNRTGSDPHLSYSGGSLVIGPRGDVLGELADQESVLSVNVNPSDVTDWRATFPAWKDGRVNLTW